MNKILIIDDDRELCALIKRSVQAENIEADFCNTGKEGLQKLREQEYQLVVLDVMMPGMDGFETLEEIRKENSLPILMFTSKNDSISKVRGLRAGADDYLTKPFDMEEVLARIESNLRRVQFQKDTPTYLRHGDLILDLNDNTAFLQDSELTLTAKEFAILELLMKYPDKIFSKANLFQSVWNTEYISEDNTLNVHISNLRNKLKAVCPDKDFIDTVWGIGYRLHKARD